MGRREAFSPHHLKYHTTFLLTFLTIITVLIPAFAQVDFSGPEYFPVGVRPGSIAIGDFNNDGNQDLAVTNRDGDHLSILLGDGTGGFGPATNLLPGLGQPRVPRAVAIADFNGDGNQDLAVGNAIFGKVSVLLGDGTGGFDPPAHFQVGGSDAPSVAVGDFNNDGNQDLAVAAYRSNGDDVVSVLLGDGTGNFSAATNFSLSCPWAIEGCTPDTVAIGDFNNDGNQDLVTANRYGSNVTVLLGDGTGSFYSITNFPSGIVPSTAVPASVAIGDFNNDGNQDLVTSNADDPSLSILLGDGTGAFGPPTNHALSALSSSVAVGDFNNDSNQDLAAVSGSIVSILLGDGTGGFGSPLNFSVNSPVSIAVGDFNNDGRQDMVTANWTYNNVAILLNTTNHPPVADAGPDQIVNENTLVMLDGSGSSDPDGDLLTYNWTQTAGPAVTLSDATAVQPTFTAPSVGPSGALLTFQLTVDDGRGGTDSDSVDIMVNNVNQAPSCNDISISTDEDSSVDIDLSSYCTDPDGDSLQGSFVSDPSHGTAQFLSPTIRYIPDENFYGSDSFTFRVSDGELESNTATVNVTVNEVNDTPVAEAGPDQSADEGDAVTLDGSASYDPDGDPLTCTWAPGDGSPLLDGCVITHAYVDNGVYTAILTVDDGRGGTDTDTAQITVNNVPPTVEAGPDQTADVGQPVSFSGSFTDPGTADTHTIEWDFGDGHSASGTLTPTHSYSVAGLYTVTLTVTDDDGGVGEDTLTVTVNAPVLVATKQDLDPTGPPLYAGEELEYEITITNMGTAAQPDNPENEFEDPLPTGTSFVAGSLTASSGAASFESSNNRIVWNGALAPGESVMITFRVQIGQVATGTIIANQGTVLFDADGDGTNEAAQLTDDPNTPEPEDPTRSTGVVRRGDPNGDGEIDLRDAILCAGFALGLEDPTDLEGVACDVAPPCGAIDARDVVRIAEVALGIRDESVFTCSGASGEGSAVVIPLGTQRAQATQLRIVDRAILPGERASISITTSAALEGIQVGPQGSLSFDPQVIQIKAIRGIPPYQVLASEIDNETGKAKFMAIALGEPKSGDILDEIEVEAVGKAGESTTIKLAPDMVLDAEGNELRLGIVEGRLTLGRAVTLTLDRVLSVPNPVRNGASFTAEGQGIKDIQVQIYDLSGREIFASGWVAGKALEWNLMSNRGRPVANGVYLYIVTVRGFGGELVQSQVKKLVVLR